ncbi:ABC transporter membrane-spanning permease -sugar transporter [Streptococcus gallolyticus]|uniref:ABC transporter membrane-spanning permease -sugar transporter n=1 Tax=Streptococcus gallolyticus TaxID=315405 RepID=A0AA94SA60_9STRE|nr:sugar ABC transporter permease [Streptococcus gallolyticus]AQP42542.1 putative binding-protein-dependent transportsystems inner membrane component [Streptococcus gallolyticus subsp. gallolyticus DSM 16831]SQG79847.1 ABC transporter membrane-spanning permease -sugar transporter [Streptococcus gallolyticus]
MRAFFKKWPQLGFIGPGFIIYTIFAIIPLFCAMYYSFFEWGGIGPMKFVGLDNFVTLFTDKTVAPIFANAIWNNLKYIICIWFIVTPVQFILAYFLFIKVRGHNYFKLMLFFPYVISSTIIGFFTTLLFDPNIGSLNDLLEKIGLPAQLWLGDPKMAFAILIGVVLWQGIGTGMMIFYSDMQVISPSLLEAADMDGANEWTKLSRIIFPMSLSSFSTNMTMSTIWALAVFDLPFLLGGVTGGADGSLDFVNIMFYRYTFGTALNGKSNMGFGAAISVVMFIIILIMTALMSFVTRKLEEKAGVR